MDKICTGKHFWLVAEARDLETEALDHYHHIAVLIEEVLTEISNTQSIHPLIAFEHLSLYIQKHLGQPYMWQYMVK